MDTGVASGDLSGQGLPPSQGGPTQSSTITSATIGQELSLLDKAAFFFDGTLLTKKGGEFAREFLSTSHPEMMSAISEFMTELQNSGYDVIDRYISRGKDSYPIMLLELRDPINGDYLIPNFNTLLEPPLDNLRDSRNTEKRRLASRSGEEEADDPRREASTLKFERLNGSNLNYHAVQLVITPTSDYGGELPEYRSSTPFVMQVISSEASAKQLFLNSESALHEPHGSYSYVLHDLILPAVRQHISAVSGAYAGIRQEPTISNDTSGIKDDVFTLEVRVPLTNSTTVHSMHYGLDTSSLLVKIAKVTIVDE